MLRLIDRYVVRGIVAPFGIALLVFTFILLVPYVVGLVEELIAKGVPMTTVLHAMVTLLPQALAVTIPMSLLVALLVALSRLSGDREWVALQACGVSAFRLLRPVLLVSVMGWAATSWVIIWAVPDANQTFREIRYSIVAQRAEGEVRSRVFFEDFPNRVLYVRDVPERGTGWNNVFMADSTKPENLVVFFAERGRLLLDRVHRTVELILEDGTQHLGRADTPQEYSVQRFAQMRVSLDPESMFPGAGPQKGDREMTIAELRANIDVLKAQGISTHNAVMEIQKKFSIPVACVVFAFLGLALGLTTRRDGKLASFALGIGVIFAYYVVMWTSQSAAKGAMVPAWLAMWIPNIVLGGLGIVLVLGRGPWASRWLTAGVAATRRVARLWPVALAGRVFRRTATPLKPERTSLVARRSKRRWIPSPSILDGYIIRIYARIASLSFIALIGIFYISTFIDLSDKLFKGTATGTMLLQYLWYATPQFMYYCIPLAVLLAGLVTVGLLTRSSELVVMRACGISLYRTALPLVLFAMVASSVLFLFEENVLAYSNRRAESMRHVIRSGSPRTFDVLNRKWVVGREGEIYNYVYFDPGKSELSNLSIFRFAPKSWRLQSRTFYRHARFTGPTTAQDAKVSWDARDGWIREFDRRAEARGFQLLPSSSVELEPPRYFATEQPDAARMTYRQLRLYIAELRSSGFDVTKHEVDLHRKISFPWVTVIMTLLAVPFASMTGRRGALYGVGLGVVIAIVYWMTTSVSAALGASGVLAPVLAAWAPNVLFGAAAMYLLLTVRT